jgi:acyl carrier protein
MNDIMYAVKDYILTTFLPGEDPEALTPGMPLRSSGILDSLATLDLVSFLEERFGIELEAHDIDPSRLETLDDITKLVQSKLAANA